MTSIDSTGRFLHQIAEQVAALGRQGPLKTGNRPPSRTDKRPTGTPPDTQAIIARRVLAISPDDPQRRRKAFRVFLESVLTTELGTDLVNDPAFHRLVDDVQRTMEADTERAAAMERAGEFLLAQARSK